MIISNDAISDIFDELADGAEVFFEIMKYQDRFWEIEKETADEE